MYLPPAATYPPPAIGRRSVLDTSSVKPADVVYGTDNVVYELFVQKTSYAKAAQICAARGTSLASFKSETDQVFVGMICDQAAGMKCWVAGVSSKDRCPAVQSSKLVQERCVSAQQFVCQRVAEE